ncbi:transcription factor HES-1 [Pimephales promelas]|nr:transcription factor HES-1 [Pimephales promelas]
MDRKLLKPEVERRRRERMNRSLENLRTLLLQGPEHNSPSQRRLEKAEILEYTVLFLQNSVAQAKAKDVEREEKHQFVDGFSSCLQRAARFLSDEGDSHGLEASVSETMRHRLTRPACRPASDCRSGSRTPPERMFQIHRTLFANKDFHPLAGTLCQTLTGLPPQTHSTRRAGSTLSNKQRSV